MMSEDGVVTSSFRKKIESYKILVSCIYHIPIISAGLIVQLAVIYIFNNTLAINVFYFFVGLGRLLGVSENGLSFLWVLNGLGYWLLICYGLFSRIPKPVKKYLPCPSCKKSVIVYEDWLCYNCEQSQLQDRYVTDKCSQCKQKIKQIRCDRCGIRIDL